MTTEIPRLVILDLYRKAIDTVEHLSKKYIDRRVHAWAVKEKKELGKMMLEMAQDEMTVDVEDEKEKEKRQDEEFFA